ncbi:MAG: photosystem I assembly protein Ycf4 [Synechococcales cyanobacterium RM1_1_8]|nr:photosystem I assembly protein Ycf4 [Synechococcales cyanobacterium RM1_1_8]
MTAQATANTKVLRQKVLGSRRLSNYFWALVVLGGGLGFLLSSVSSYTKINLLPLSDPTQLLFLPQGLVMGFYGIAALVLGSFLMALLLWDVGGGFNEFNQETQQVTIYRQGYPGKNRKVELIYPIADVQSVRVTLKEGINPKRALYLNLRDRGDIPLTRVGQPISLAELENQGAELARFMGVPLEGL